MRFYVYAVLLVLMLTELSCKPVVMMVYGIHNPKTLSDAEILRYAKRYGTADNDVYKLDTSFTRVVSKKQYALRNDTLKYETRKNISQPIQYLLFDKQGNLIRYVINCYAKGTLTGLNWNSEGTFNTFPPAMLTPIDSVVNYAFVSPYLLPLKKSENKADYTCVIIWNKFIGRQSKRLMHTAMDNVKRYAGNNRVHFIFVNNDNFYRNLDD